MPISFGSRTHPELSIEFTAHTKWLIHKKQIWILAEACCLSQSRNYAPLGRPLWPVGGTWQTSIRWSGSDGLVLCSRCSVCQKALTSWYFEKGGALYCKDDYWSKFGESCNGCTSVITGPVMVSVTCFQFSHYFRFFSPFMHFTNYSTKFLY